MSAASEAKELVDSFRNYVSERDFFGDNVETKNAKKCATITVYKMLSSDGWSSSMQEWAKFREYYLDVIDEIELL